MREERNLAKKQTLERLKLQLVAQLKAIKQKPNWNEKGEQKYAETKPRHWVCKPAYLVPLPSQDKVGGLWQEGHPA